MEQLMGLSRSRQIILGACALLLIATFLPWQKVSFSLGEFGEGSVSRNAWHGFWGVLLGLLTIVLLLWVAARAFGIALPANIPDGLATLALGAAIFLFALLKNLTDDFSAWGSYIGIVLAAGVAYGAWLAFQESGEELPAMPRGTAAAPAAPASTTPPAPESTPPSSDEEPPAQPAGSTPA
jgi:hypothetical protein